jgi:glycerol-3-phosphate dehydrogenase (NAD(P)+)
MRALDIGVIGAGSYGTCLAIMAAEAGHRVSLWCRSETLADKVRATRENERYLPGYRLAESAAVTTDLAEAVAGKQLLLGVTPSHAIREVLGKVIEHLEGSVVMVNASKGLEEGTFDRVDQIYTEVLPAPIAERATFLSGPTFAKEVAAGAPSAIVVAGRDPQATELVQEALSTERFRVYSSDDVIGVQIGGALKNVIAICAGVSDGLGFGQNARAALITRGLAEISRIGVALGADQLTFMGLSGLGDLVLTCAGDLSRNRQVGLALGRGRKLDEIVSEMHMVAEGVKTTKVAHQLAKRLGVEAPLAEFAHAVLYDGVPAAEGLQRLMGRALKRERD